MKNKRNILRWLVLSTLASIAIYSCTHVSGTFISTHGSMDGSSMKDNCMDCHQNGATEGAFVVGGTVFKADLNSKNPNGDVLLFSADSTKKDSIVAKIEVDGVGNFYTTHPIDMTGGVIPAIQYGEVIIRMQTPTANGACNSCHDGKTTDKIHTN